MNTARLHYFAKIARQRRVRDTETAGTTQCSPIGQQDYFVTSIHQCTTERCYWPSISLAAISHSHKLHASSRAIAQPQLAERHAIENCGAAPSTRGQIYIVGGQPRQYRVVHEPCRTEEPSSAAVNTTRSY